MNKKNFETENEIIETWRIENKNMRKLSSLEYGFLLLF
jgi:hypothetical protein